FVVTLPAVFPPMLRSPETEPLPSHFPNRYSSRRGCAHGGENTNQKATPLPVANRANNKKRFTFFFMDPPRLRAPSGLELPGEKKTHRVTLRGWRTCCSTPWLEYKREIRWVQPNGALPGHTVQPAEMYDLATPFRFTGVR